MQRRDLRQSDERYVGSERRTAEVPRRLGVAERRAEGDEVNEYALIIKLLEADRAARERQQELYDRELAGINGQLDKLNTALERERRWRTGLLLGLVAVAFLVDPEAALKAIAVWAKP